MTLYKSNKAQNCFNFNYGTRDGGPQRGNMIASANLARKTQGHHAVKFFNPMVDYQYIHRAFQFNGWFVEERSIWQ